jgi:hypothetical protein
MRLRINKISLVGTSREFTLNRSLNIVTGSIFTGKTTLMRCIRGLLGSSLNKFSREARTHITNLAGEILIGNDIYEVIRPFVTTDYAPVSIGGESEAERLPALRGKSDEKTYGDWLLEKFGLPNLKVPNAPTRDDSETSSLSVNDYLMYCYLRQTEISTSVFGHTDNYKNNKRKFVFEVIYGKYDVEVAQLQMQRREIVRELRRLENYATTIEEFISGTPFQNRVRIERPYYTILTV